MRSTFADFCVEKFRMLITMAWTSPTPYRNKIKVFIHFKNFWQNIFFCIILILRSARTQILGIFWLRFVRHGLIYFRDCEEKNIYYLCNWVFCIFKRLHNHELKINISTRIKFFICYKFKMNFNRIYSFIFLNVTWFETSGNCCSKQN
jgi:hypothetical protein